MMRKFLFSFLLLLALPITPAPATILQVAGEDVDMVLVGAVSTSTSSSVYRSGYARLASGMQLGFASDPPNNRLTLPVFPNQGTIWFHAETIQGTNAFTSFGINAVMVHGSDGVIRFVIQGTGTSGQVTLRKRDSSATYTTVATCTSGVFPATALHKLDFFLNYSVSGEATLYIDGVQACDFIGDVTTNGITAVNQIEVSTTNINNSTTWWSEMIVSTTDTRNMNLVTLSPVSNGNTMAWSGTVSNVNGTNYNDTSPLTTGSTGQIAEFTTGTLPSGSYTIPAVIQSARAEIGASGPQHFTYTIRPGSGSTDYQSANATPSTAFLNYQNIWTTNPANSAGWTNADIANIQYGITSQP